MKTVVRVVVAALGLLVSSYALATVQVVPLETKVGGKVFEHQLVYDDAVSTARPGLLMVPDWLGINGDNIAKAKQIAGSGQVLLLTDMYGKGVRPKNSDEAKAQVTGLYKDLPELRRRINSALAMLKSQSKAKVDDRAVAAIGYCFGGTSVLELARSGAALNAVVSFHGGLGTSMPAADNAVKAGVLVLNGAEDKGTAADVAPFQDEMRKAKADWMFVNLAGAVHCFALPHANREGCKYHSLAAARAERIMWGFLQERFRAQVPSDSSSGMANQGRTALVIHGGAGVMDRKAMTAADQAAIRAGLDAALTAGNRVLSTGGNAVDAVNAAINVLEDNPLFNAGKGAVFNAAGKHELDASLMEGHTGRAGAVAGVVTIRNPINLARAVMERSEHVMLMGDGAEHFADAQPDIARVPNSYFDTESRRKALLKAQQQLQSGVKSKAAYFGTVGAVALDAAGHIAAATSTGGMTNKKWGRVGDSPIIGAGTWADANCGISATGWGEFFIRNAVAHDICKRVEYRGDSLRAASDYVINEEIPAAGGNGGVIGLDAAGNLIMPFNTSGMYRGWIATDGSRGTAIFKD